MAASAVTGEEFRAGLRSSIPSPDWALILRRRLLPPRWDFSRWSWSTQPGSQCGNSHGRIRCLCLQDPEHALDGREDILGLEGLRQVTIYLADDSMLMRIARFGYHPHLEVCGCQDSLDGPFPCPPRAGVQSRERNHLTGQSPSLPARHAAQDVASRGHSEKLARRSTARDEACEATVPNTIVRKRLKRQPG